MLISLKSKFGLICSTHVSVKMACFITISPPSVGNYFIYRERAVNKLLLFFKSYVDYLSFCVITNPRKQAVTKLQDNHAISVDEHDLHKYTLECSRSDST